MEVPAKEGFLYLQCVKFGKKTWRRIWVRLFQPSSSGIGRLELLDARDAGPSQGSGTVIQGWKRGEKRVIRLDDCLSITPALEESSPQDCAAFYLCTARRDYTLAGEIAEDWVSKLCQIAFQKNDGNQDKLTTGGSGEITMAENELYFSWATAQYKVLIQRTEAAVRCNLFGSYLLSPRNEALFLLDPLTAQTVYSWPYRLLRRFGQDKDGVTVEAGRRCDSGEGHFTFLSKDGAQIYRAIEEAIIKQTHLHVETRADTEPPVAIGTEEALPSQKVNSGNRKGQIDSLPSCLDRNTPALPPKNSSMSDLYSLQQERNSPVELDSELYRTVQHPARDKQQPLAQESSPIFIPWKSHGDWGETEDGNERDDEDRLFSLESLCLDNAEEGVCPEKSPLYYNIQECEDMKAEVRQDGCSSEGLYSTVNSCQTKKKEQSEKDNQIFMGRTTSVVTTTEIPVDFKQRLSNVLFKDQSKFQPLLPIRCVDTAKTINSPQS